MTNLTAEIEHVRRQLDTLLEGNQDNDQWQTAEAATRYNQLVDRLATLKLEQFILEKNVHALDRTPWHVVKETILPGMQHERIEFYLKRATMPTPANTPHTSYTVLAIHHTFDEALQHIRDEREAYVAQTTKPDRHVHTPTESAS